ncbi:MAG: hypothetical protein AAF587_03580 [Bacteroidota bacterium]
MKHNNRFSLYFLLLWVFFSGTQLKVLAGSSQSIPSHVIPQTISISSTPGLKVGKEKKKHKIHSIWKESRVKETDKFARIGLVLFVAFSAMVFPGIPALLAITRVAFIVNFYFLATGLVGASSITLGILALRRIKKNGKDGKRNALFAIFGPFLTVGIAYGLLFLALMSES